MAVDAKHSNNVWIYLAYSFILLSYLNVNILFIRIFLICASLSFITFAITFGNVFVDSLVFNCVFIIINGTYCYYLLLRYLPIKLKPLEERIYEKDFKRVMDRMTFRDFIRKAHLRTFSEGGQICHHGNNFSGPFYVAMIKPGFKIVYIKTGKEYFEVKENSWIGVAEYMMYEKEKKIHDKQAKPTKTQKVEQEDANALIKYKKVKVRWGLDALVKENHEQNETRQQVFEEDEDPCYVYEFPLGELEKLFKDKNEGVLWKNALYSIWLGYTTKAIIGVDLKVSQQEKYKRRETIVNSVTNQMISTPSNQMISTPSNQMKPSEIEIEMKQVALEDNKICVPNKNKDSEFNNSLIYPKEETDLEADFINLEVRNNIK